MPFIFAPKPKEAVMKKSLYFWLAAALLSVSCSKSGFEETTVESQPLSHGMIVLGDRLDNPYTVANVREAYKSVYPTRSASEDIRTTNLYVRFLPQSDADFRELESLGVKLLDHPMDYQIIQDGDYYHDPSVGEEEITWQYAVVDNDFECPEHIPYEIIDECFLSENQNFTRAGVETDWDAVEKEAYRLTGNARLYRESLTKASSVQPSGRITISDPHYLGGKPVGLSGVQVMTNIFVKFSTTYTDRDGYYTIPTKYSGHPYYRVVFKNTKGFTIGFNWVLVPASVSTLGKNGPEGISCHITQDSDYELFTRGITNNAAYDYFERCGSLGVAAPPSNVRFWMFKFLDVSSAVMLQQGTLYDANLLTRILGNYVFLLKFFSPDITIGTKNYGHPYRIYSSAVHELAHASHFSAVGTQYWTPYVLDILEGYVQSGFQNPYGNGTEKDAGYCEVGEMWAYYLESKLFEERYHYHWATFGSGNWFFPQILSALEERGVSTGEIYAALKPDVNTRDKLQESLIAVVPEKRNLIHQIFERYGK